MGIGIEDRPRNELHRHRPIPVRAKHHVTPLRRRRVHRLVYYPKFMTDFSDEEPDTLVAALVLPLELLSYEPTDLLMCFRDKKGRYFFLRSPFTTPEQTTSGGAMRSIDAGFTPAPLHVPDFDSLETMVTWVISPKPKPKTI